jgi:hypothetical protein
VTGDRENDAFDPICDIERIGRPSPVLIAGRAGGPPALFAETMGNAGNKIHDNLVI